MIGSTSRQRIAFAAKSFFQPLVSILRSELTSKHYNIPPDWPEDDVVEG
jgi:hypothetical protein